MVVVVRWGVLVHVAELGMVNRGRRVCLHPGSVVQVGGVRGVRDEGGMQGLRGGAGGLCAPGAKQRPQQGRGAGKGLATVAGWAVSAGGGPSSHVGTANDGPLQEKRESDHNGDTAGGLGGGSSVILQFHTAALPA